MHTLCKGDGDCDCMVCAGHHKVRLADGAAAFCLTSVL